MPEDNDSIWSVGVGAVIDERYKLLSKLGSGGAAVVYKALHLQLGRQVAIKLLDFKADDDQQTVFEERFRREARAISTLDHPNIVTIHDFSFQPRPYIVMELLQGHDLEVELDENGPLEPSRCLRLLSGALDALGEAHEKGITHRDLKPPNLFIKNPDGKRETLVLLDFGIAYIHDKSHRLTETGQLFGTPQYLAPEWIREQLVTPAIDVYQIGLILAEMLTGIPAVNHVNPYDCLMAHCKGDLDIPPAILESPIGAVIMKATAVEVDERYQSALELKAALDAVDPDSLIALSNPIGTPTRISAMRISHEDVVRAASQTGQGDTVGDLPEAPPALGKPIRTFTILGVLLLFGSTLALALYLFGGGKPAERSVDADVHIGSTTVDPVAVLADAVDTTSITPLAHTNGEDVTDQRGDEPSGEDVQELPEATEPLPSKFVVKVVSDPPQAQVMRGSALLGITPFELELADTDPFEVSVVREGYQSATITVQPNAGEDLQVTLERRERPKTDRTKQDPKPDVVDVKEEDTHKRPLVAP
ncbi:MAG: hypothetical protein AUK47_06625 [Deltaproteobacteria bacterium CG2_30_63_29]|nr:MAG: hypothetical protein AUK47_06625 [Deltaproteobacteria bacterium CG2_30_63_29]